MSQQASSVDSDLDQIADLVQNMGLDNMHRMVEWARQRNTTTAEGSNTATAFSNTATAFVPVPTLPASSSIQPATTIESRPAVMEDDAPLTGLLSLIRQRPDEQESTSMAAILQEASPLPAPQPAPLTTWMGVEPTAEQATAPAPPCVYVPPHQGMVMRQRNRRAVERPTAIQEEVFLGRRGRNSPYVDPPEVQELPTAQRQRMNPEGDYYTREPNEEEPTTRWHRGDNQGYWSYRNLERQRNTATTQAEWHQHPLWRVCGPCLEQYDNQFWIWNRCCARCATFLCSIHGTELVSPTYQREREGGHELEETFYCGSTTQMLCPQCLEISLREIGDQTH
eukprot:154969-Amphidinium_carterae.1